MKIDTENLKQEAKKLCNLLYKANSFFKYSTLIYTIDNLNEIYKLLTGDNLEIIIPINPYYESMFDKKDDYRYPLVRDYFDNLDNHLKISKMVNDIYDEEGFIYYDREKSESKLTEKYMRDLIRSFLNEYDPALYKLFQDSFELIHECYFKEPANLTYNIYGLSKSYILINHNPTIEGAATIIHELGHAHFNKKFNNISFKQSVNTYNYYYFEVFSMFLEKAFIDYLIENNINKKDASFSENFYLYTIVDNFSLVNELKDIMNIDYMEIDDMEFTYNSLIYGYGGLISLELLDRYKKNSELTKYNIENFIASQGLLSGDELLSKIDITQSDLMSCKILRKSLNEHNKNIRKATNIY